MSLLSPLILLLGGSRFFVIGAYSVSLQALILVLSAASSPLAAQDLAAKNIDPAFEQRVLDVIRRNPAALIEALNSYERQQDEAKLREQSVQLQRIYPRPSELIGESPRRGNGKVVLVEFSDFQCPYCAKAHNELVAFIQRHGKGVTFVYKHLPLTDIHPHALPAARAAWAAGRQGKFWAYHDALFANQARLGEPLYEEIATGLKLNQARFNEDHKGTASLQAIQKDLDQAKRLGVRGTPTMVMNQQFLMGPFTLEVLEKQLDQLTISKRSKPRLMNSKEGE
jgi:protein-disulfide isomerase